MFCLRPSTTLRPRTKLTTWILYSSCGAKPIDVLIYEEVTNTTAIWCKSCCELSSQLENPGYATKPTSAYIQHQSISINTTLEIDETTLFHILNSPNFGKTDFTPDPDKNNFVCLKTKNHKKYFARLETAWLKVSANGPGAVSLWSFNMEPSRKELRVF